MSPPRVRTEGAAECPGGVGVSAGRAADAEVDAAGIEGFERAELLGDLERGVVGEHDAAGADADRGGVVGDIGDENGGGGGGDAGDVVVLGEPVAGVAEAFGVLGEVAGVLEGVGGGGTCENGGEVEEGEGNGGHACSFRGHGILAPGERPVLFERESRRLSQAGFGSC